MLSLIPKNCLPKHEKLSLIKKGDRVKFLDGTTRIDGVVQNIVPSTIHTPRRVNVQVSDGTTRAVSRANGLRLLNEPY